MKKTDDSLGSLKNKQILKAALTVFSTYGLQGANLEKIAETANVSKSNLFYYFESKEELYVAVLSSVLEEWLSPLDCFTENSEPKEVLTQYIEMKYEISKRNPQASRLYALEMIQGAPYLTHILKKHLKPRVRKKVEIIYTWIEQGKIKDISPLHLILHIWAVTQHYADFETQIQLISGHSLKNKNFKATALETTKMLLIDNLIKP